MPTEDSFNALAYSQMYPSRQLCKAFARVAMKF